MCAGSGASTGLSITNPLVLYRTLLATNKIRPDPAQHRLALQLQKLYFRLKDYSPELEYRHRLDEITRSLAQTQHVPPQKKGHSAGQTTTRGFLASLLRTGGHGHGPTLSLTRTIPIHDSALSIDSPQGMLLYGEVGRGKSMLLDLLYNSLPSSKKRRWHFNTFMLDIFRRLELSRIERASLNQDFQHEHVILTLAKDSIAHSPILFLDEFQMPDRTASKLLNGFMTAFFHLGGVLVASSNRMPDELSKASGVEFQSDRSRSASSLFGWGIKRLSDGQIAARSDFGMFLEVLKARCEVWQMEGERDWRREDDIVSHSDQDGVPDESIPDESIPDESVGNEPPPPVGLVKSTDSAVENLSSDAPPYYHVSMPSSSPSSPTTAWASQVDSLNPSGEWSPKTLIVYSRPLHLTHTNSGIVLATFDELCAKHLGPADYTSLCAHFHTLILTEVPVLTTALKNEARRFITLLDALYEARCRLLVQAAAPPDKLFFPETRATGAAGAAAPGGVMADESGDSIESEAYAEVYQDSTAPFRPNISLYDDSSDAKISSAFSTTATAPVAPSPSPGLFRSSVLADEDADFGPTYGNGRSHRASSNDIADIERRQQQQGGGDTTTFGPDFTNISGLVGQDEMFAFKRARSRLWEMCGRKWWRERSGSPATTAGAAGAGTPEQWWTPVDHSTRFWEPSTTNTMTASNSNSNSDSVSTDTSITSHKKESPPQFGSWHAWGLGEWGKKGSGRAKELKEQRKYRG